MKLIKVIYPNGVGYVQSHELDELIAQGKILAFERSNRLVVIGFHPIRHRQVAFDHSERRVGT